MSKRVMTFLVSLVGVVWITGAYAETLTAADRLTLAGPAAKFDFMTADPTLKRILAAHRGAKTVEIVDLKTGQSLKPVTVGEAQGLAVDSHTGRYFFGNQSERSVVAVDAKTFAKVGEAKVQGPVDAITFDEKNNRIYAAEDDGKRLFIVDATAMKLAGSVAIPGAPEDLKYDAKSDRIYLNIKDKNLVVRINPATSKVEATWPSAPATSPHGLAVDSERGRIYTAGGNGELVALDAKTGKVVGTAEIPVGVDQIAYDRENNMIYSACKGFISATKVSDKGLTDGGRVASPKGAHTLAVDPASHDVWVSYADNEHSYLQKFKVTK